MPAVLNFLSRLGLFLIFFMPGLDKIQKLLSGDTGLVGMLSNAPLQLPAGIAIIAAWVLALTELLAPIVLIIGKLAPRWLYKAAALGLLIISLVITIYYSSGADWSRNLLMVLVALGLFMSKPMCAMGITGDKTCADGSCKTNCDDKRCDINK